MFLKIEQMRDDKQKNDEPYFLYGELLFCAGNKAADDFQEHFRNGLPCLGQIL